MTRPAEPSAPRVYDARWVGAHGIGRHAQEVADRLPDGWDRLFHDGGPRPWGRAEPVRMLRRLQTLPDRTTVVSAGYNLPLRGWEGSRAVATIHSGLHLQRAVNSRRYEAGYYARHLLAALRRAPLVLTVSDATRAEVAELAGTDPDRIEVIGNGVSAAFVPADPERTPIRASARPRVLASSSPKAHKNLVTVLGALARPELRDVHLTLLGGLNDVVRTLGADLHAQGRLDVRTGLDDRELAAELQAADLFLALSLQEGFDLPLVEAVATETPVVASDIAVHREVAGDLEAVLLVPALDEAAVAAAIARTLAEPPSPESRAYDRVAVRKRHDRDQVVTNLVDALERRGL